jgi:zinc protease
MARWYGAALTTGATVEEVAAWPRRVSTVTADEVREAARTWLEKTRSVTGYLVKELRARLRISRRRQPGSRGQAGRRQHDDVADRRRRG